MFKVMRGALQLKRVNIGNTTLLSIYNENRDMTILTTLEQWAEAVDAANWSLPTLERLPDKRSTSAPNAPNEIHEVLLLPKRHKPYDLNWYQSTEQCCADEFARQLHSEFRDVWNAGIHSHRGIARELNERCINMRGGSDWDSRSVARVITRLERLYNTDWMNEDERP